jgi:hypothetical protein
MMPLMPFGIAEAGAEIAETAAKETAASIRVRAALKVNWIMACSSCVGAALLQRHEVCRTGRRRGL